MLYAQSSKLLGPGDPMNNTDNNTLPVYKRPTTPLRVRGKGWIRNAWGFSHKLCKERKAQPWNSLFFATIPSSYLRCHPPPPTLMVSI
jgi:hypothetical protein